MIVLIVNILASQYLAEAGVTTSYEQRAIIFEWNLMEFYRGTLPLLSMY